MIIYLLIDFLEYCLRPDLRRPENSFNVRWVRQFKGSILVLFHEKLKTDLLNSLTKMAAFTDSQITLAKLWCIFHQTQTGLFHRKPVPVWMSRSRLINKQIEDDISTWKRALDNAIKSRTLEIATN